MSSETKASAKMKPKDVGQRQRQRHRQKAKDISPDSLFKVTFQIINLKHTHKDWGQTREAVVRGGRSRSSGSMP